MTSLFVLAMRLRTRALPTPRKAKPTSIAKSVAKKTPPLKEGRRSADRRVQEPHRKGMRRASFLLSPHAERTEAQDFIEPWTSWSGRARLSAPHRGIRGFGLGSARAALPGTTGCKREDPLRHQCSEHLAVRHAPDGTMPKPPASAVYRRAPREPLPLRPKEYPRDKASFASGILGKLPLWGRESRALSLYQGHRKCLHQRRTRLGAPLFKFVIRIVLFFEATQIAKSERRIAQRSLPSDAGCSCMAPRIFLRNLIE